MVTSEIFQKHITECPHFFYPDVDWQIIEDELAETVTVSNSRKRKYFEVPISFDIEVTSFSSSSLEKAACMYAWAVSIQGYVILGRTWDEFYEVYDRLVDMFEPDKDTHLLIYVQNFAYEFQFICKRFEWRSVFCLKKRKPLKAVTKEYVEFRCSYMLSGFSLAKIGENLQRYKIEKMVGDLDYDKIRHHKTPLTEKEWKYIINDVQVVVAYIQETAENDGGYHKIPLTKTGYVRDYCREICFKAKNYRKFISQMQIDLEEYKQLKRAFAGGFTHANWHYVENTQENVDSFDFTSSYPYVMVAEKFPMSSSRLIDNMYKEKMEYYLNNYCCLFDIIIHNIDGWDAPDHILSYSKCRKVSKDRVLNNGRIISATYLETTITDVDYRCLEKFYKWKNIQVANFRIYDRKYLPTAFVESIIKMYEDKTELKGIPEKEVEYMKSKGMVNSAYGMTVTDIVRDEETFDEDWKTNEADAESEIAKYNGSKKRFLFYPWGVWVTAYARRNLYTGILEFDDDYIYSDTDSLKCHNSEAHSSYLEQYNAEVEEKLRKACEYHGIDFERTRPKTIKGEQKPLGVWDYEGRYSKFKTLGAKRYLVEENGKLKITVAGLSKQNATEYLVKESKKRGVSPFDIFTNNLTVPAESTGKSIHTFIDFEFSTQLEDYLGNKEIIHEYSAIHLAPTEYHLSMEESFLDLLSGIRLEET